MRLALAGSMAAAVMAAAGAALAAGGAGRVTQKPGAAGCVSSSVAGCTEGRGLGGARIAALSPDGRNVYAAAYGSDAVTAFGRDGSGALTQTGCHATPASPGCLAARGLDGASTVAVSPDGRNVYVAAEDSDAVTVFDRAAGGGLTQKPGEAGCIAAAGAAGECAIHPSLEGARFVTVSPDGENVYAAAQDSHAIVSFARDPATGELTPAGATTGPGLRRVVALAVSPEGTDVYAVAEHGTADNLGRNGAVTSFDRDPATGALTQKPGEAGCISEIGDDPGCADGHGLAGATSLTLSPDGRDLYVASYFIDALTSFRRDAGGRLSQTGCFGGAGDDPACVPMTGLDGVHGVAVSPDGRNLYAAAKYADVMTIWDRDAGSGGLARKPGTEGCVSAGGSDGIGGPTSACAVGTALEHAHLPAVSPDGGQVYLTAYDAAAIAVFDRLRVAPAPSPTCLGAGATVVGSPGRDVLRGTRGADVFAALGGDDVILAFGGPDRACGGRGGDVLRLGRGRDRARGGPGHDRLLGGPGPDRLLGGPGADVLLGQSGRDGLAGGPGADREAP